MLADQMYDMQGQGYEDASRQVPGANDIGETIALLTSIQDQANEGQTVIRDVLTRREEQFAQEKGELQSENTRLRDLNEQLENERVWLEEQKGGVDEYLREGMERLALEKEQIERDNIEFLQKEGRRVFDENDQYLSQQMDEFEKQKGPIVEEAVQEQVMRASADLLAQERKKWEDEKRRILETQEKSIQEGIDKMRSQFEAEYGTADIDKERSTMKEQTHSEREEIQRMLASERAELMREREIIRNKMIEIDREQTYIVGPDAYNVAPFSREMVDLNVGGSYFTTSIATLSTVEDSRLARMVRTYDPDLPRDYYGRIFIDRDPQNFKAILTLLRAMQGGEAPLRITFGDSMYRDLEYYGMEMISKIRVQCPNATTIDVTYNPIMSVGKLKAQVARAGFGGGAMSIYMGGKKLPDNKSVRECKIPPAGLVQLFKGGGPGPPKGWKGQPTQQPQARSRKAMHAQKLALDAEQWRLAQHRKAKGLDPNYQIPSNALYFRPRSGSPSRSSLKGNLSRSPSAGSRRKTVRFADQEQNATSRTPSPSSTAPSRSSMGTSSYSPQRSAGGTSYPGPKWTTDRARSYADDFKKQYMPNDRNLERAGSGSRSPEVSRSPSKGDDRSPYRGSRSAADAFMSKISHISKSGDGDGKKGDSSRSPDRSSDSKKKRSKDKKRDRKKRRSKDKSSRRSKRSSRSSSGSRSKEKDRDRRHRRKKKSSRDKKERRSERSERRSKRDKGSSRRHRR